MRGAKLIAEPVGRETFRAWAAGRDGRFERIGGQVVAMAPERAAHVRVKSAVWLTLREALATAGIGSCEALGDGVTVEIGDHTDYEPDAVVNCGPRLADDAVAAATPVVVVEVLSPSSHGADTGAKLADYLSVPSIAHYLIVHPTRRQVIHHRRGAERIDTQILSAGALVLDPPGITVAIDDFYR